MYVSSCRLSFAFASNILVHDLIRTTDSTAEGVPSWAKVWLRLASKVQLGGQRYGISRPGLSNASGTHSRVQLILLVIPRAHYVYLSFHLSAFCIFSRYASTPDQLASFVTTILPSNHNVCSSEYQCTSKFLCRLRNIIKANFEVIGFPSVVLPSEACLPKPTKLFILSPSWQ